MARRPADENVNRDRQAIWESIRAVARDRREFVINDIARGNVKRGTVADYLRALKAAGIVAVAFQPVKPGQAVRYRLERNPGAEAPRVRADGSEVTQGLANEALWRTMKTIGPFTIAYLTLMASTKQVPIQPETTKSYCRFMMAAGYLRESKAEKPRDTPKFHFVKSRDPGPKPPQIQKVKRVWDPNSKQVVWSQKEPGS
jgi:hypothetical protein